MYVSAISMRLLRGRSTPAMRAMAYPCLCLCLGLEQITRTTPLRLISLHCGQIGLTDARTFMTSCSGKNPRTLIGDRDRVLEVCGHLAIFGHCRPLIIE